MCVPLAEILAKTRKLPSPTGLPESDAQTAAALPGDALPAMKTETRLVAVSVTRMQRSPGFAG